MPVEGEIKSIRCMTSEQAPRRAVHKVWSNGTEQIAVQSKKRQSATSAHARGSSHASKPDVPVNRAKSATSKGPLLLTIVRKHRVGVLQA